MPLRQGAELSPAEVLPLRVEAVPLHVEVLPLQRDFLPQYFTLCNALIYSELQSASRSAQKMLKKVQKRHFFTRLQVSSLLIFNISNFLNFLNFLNFINFVNFVNSLFMHARHIYYNNLSNYKESSLIRGGQFLPRLCKTCAQRYNTYFCIES